MYNPCEGHSVLQGHSVYRDILSAGTFCVQGHSVLQGHFVLQSNSVCRVILCAGTFRVQGHSLCRVILCAGQGEGTQPPSLLSPPGAGSVRLCNAIEAESCPTPHPSPPAS
jgi:hypothetical protein